MLSLLVLSDLLIINTISERYNNSRLKMTPFAIICYIFLVCLVAFCVRVIYLLFKIFTSDCALTCSNSIRTVMCVGSGGHTTELMRLTSRINMKKYNPRLYILADNDATSELKIHQTENDRNYTLSRIPRSRNVMQSYQSSIKSTLYATIVTVPIIFNFKPNVIICNGPGTCIPICVVAFILRSLFLLDCRIVFVESVCRVRTLSLTGKILVFFADLFIVQWPELRDACFRAKYFGRLT